MIAQRVLGNEPRRFDFWGGMIYFFGKCYVGWKRKIDFFLWISYSLSSLPQSKGNPPPLSSHWNKSNTGSFILELIFKLRIDEKFFRSPKRRKYIRPAGVFWCMRLKCEWGQKVDTSPTRGSVGHYLVLSFVATTAGWDQPGGRPNPKTHRGNRQILDLRLFRNKSTVDN